jgi:hypothetical protein
MYVSPQVRDRLIIICASGAWMNCLFFWIIQKAGWFAQYKLPRNRPDMDPSLPSNVARDNQAIIEQILGTFIFVPLAIYFGYPFLVSRIQVGGDAPGYAQMGLEVVLMIIGCDAMFYWVHRLLHHPLLYTFHKKVASCSSAPPPKGTLNQNQYDHDKTRNNAHLTFCLLPPFRSIMSTKPRTYGRPSGLVSLIWFAILLLASFRVSRSRYTFFI